jgi:hypothetical protein
MIKFYFDVEIYDIKCNELTKLEEKRKTNESIREFVFTFCNYPFLKWIHMF